MIGQILGDISLVDQLDHFWFRFLGRSGSGPLTLASVRIAPCSIRTFERRGSESGSSRRPLTLASVRIAPCSIRTFERSGFGSGSSRRPLTLASVRIATCSIRTFGWRRRRSMSCWWIWTAVAFQSSALADGIANAHVTLGKHGVVLALGVIAVLALPRQAS